MWLSGRPGPRLLPCLLLFALAVLGCGATGQGPVVTRVDPAQQAPGGLLLISGRGFTPIDTVRVGGRTADAITWVNSTLLTAVAPTDLPAGSYEVEVRSALGRGAKAPVAIRLGGAQQAAAPATAATPSPAAGQTPPPARPVLTPSPSPTPAPTVVAPEPVRAVEPAAPPRPAPPPAPHPGKGKH